MPSKYYDPCSFSNPSLFTIEHVRIRWTVDFDRQVLKGSAQLQFVQPSSSADTATSADFIVLDTRDLLISEVYETETKIALQFELGEAHKDFGRPLKISLAALTQPIPKSLSVTIVYETSATASALQWLDAKCTLGKRHPYLFSQCQAIHARSILPCQDTPAVKFTYEASVLVRQPLTALMSAMCLGAVVDTTSDGQLCEHKFEQKIPIPSYLLALVVGDLVSKQIGPVSKVWTEREMLERAAYEFEQVDAMLKDAESLMGEYVWGSYDLLVLPTTFPFGGMENPCLTFVTPTILSGDRSLVTVIQHEIAHSWTGNLVTNASWEHFWLNEGFTRFIERKLIAKFAAATATDGERHRHFESLEGWRDLIETVDTFVADNRPALTCLVPNLTDTDPDDAFSSIPYEKGSFLLFYLEQKLGGVEVFAKYVRAHIERFKGTSIDTDDWKKFLYEYFHDKKDILDEVDWQKWLFEPGMPPVDLTPSFDKSIANTVTSLANKLYSGEIAGVDPCFVELNSNQKRELLGQLLDKEPLSVERIELIDAHYMFGSTQNAELLFRWLRLGLKAKWTPIIAPAIKFVSDQGRMKFTRPVYRDLFSWQEARQPTLDNFIKQRPFMHQTTAGLVAKDLGLTN